METFTIVMWICNVSVLLLVARLIYDCKSELEITRKWVQGIVYGLKILNIKLAGNCDKKKVSRVKKCKVCKKENKGEVE